MRFLVIFSFIIVFCKVEARPAQHDGSIAVSKNMPDVQLDTIHQAITCSRGIGPDAEELQQTHTEGIFPEDNESFNAYFGCIWKKKGIISEKAEVDENNLKRYLLDLFSMGAEVTNKQEVLADDVISHCEPVQGKDFGQKAVRINNCILTRLYELLEDEK